MILFTWEVAATYFGILAAFATIGFVLYMLDVG